VFDSTQATMNFFVESTFIKVRFNMLAIVFEFFLTWIVTLFRSPSIYYFVCWRIVAIVFEIAWTWIVFHNPCQSCNVCDCRGN